MKKLSILIASILSVFATSNAVFAQDDSNSASHTVAISIEEVAILDIESSTTNNISLNPVAPTEAGLGIDFSEATNSDLWLNYSSIVSSDITRSISATMTGNLPEGLSISVRATEPSAEGKGNLGTAETDMKELTETGITIVSNIGSCYTGNGNERGRNLIYKLNADEDNYASLLEGNYSANITYTITDVQ